MSATSGAFVGQFEGPVSWMRRRFSRTAPRRMPRATIGKGFIFIRLYQALPAKSRVPRQRAGSDPLLQHSAVADCPLRDRPDARKRSKERTCAGVGL